MKKQFLRFLGVFSLAFALGSCDVKVEVNDNTKKDDEEQKQEDDKKETKETVQIATP